MITIIAGKPGSGKTALAAYFGGTRILEHGFEDYIALKRDLKVLKAGGFNMLELPPQKHLVFADFNLRLTKRISAYYINGYEIGLTNPYFYTVLLVPHSTIILDESQKYWDSRFRTREEVYRQFQLHRQDFLNFIMTCQRLANIDLNIRAIADLFIVVDKIDIQKNKYGQIIKIVWYTTQFESCDAAERYQLASDNENTHVGKKVKIETKYNVFAWYDSYANQPAFFKGKYQTAFDFTMEEKYSKTVEDFVKYNNTHTMFAPPKYYRSKGE